MVFILFALRSFFCLNVGHALNIFVFSGVINLLLVASNVYSPFKLQVLSWFTRPLAICSGPWNRRIIAPLPKTWPCRAKATFLSTTTSEIFAFTASMENFWGKFLPNCRNIDLLIMFLCTHVLWLCPEMPWSGLLSGLGVSVLIQISNKPRQ